MMPFSHQVKIVTGHRGGKYIQYKILFTGEENSTKQKTNVRKNNLFLLYCLEKINATG